MIDRAPGSQLPPVTIQPIESGFRLTCLELGITCTAPSLESGYAALEELASITPQPRRSSSSTRPIATRAYREDISPMTEPQRIYKTFPLFRLAAAILLFPLVLITLSILNDVRFIVKDLRTFTISASESVNETPRLARQGSEGLARLADTIDKLTPNRQEELRTNLERIAVKLAPAAEGLRPLFEAMGVAEHRPGSSPIPSSPQEPHLKETDQ